MVSKNNYSLLFILSTLVVLSVTSVMIITGLLNYNQTKEVLTKDIIQSSKTSLVQLKNSIKPYIKSYAISEYEKLIENGMLHKDNLAIVIEDYNMGKILGKESFVSGKIKDENWKVIDFEDDPKLKKILNKHFIKDTQYIKDGQDILASVTIYSTDKFMIEKLDGLIYRKFFTFLTITTLMIILLTVSLNYFIVKPISNIINSIDESDKDGIPLSKVQIDGSKEILRLANSMNNMIKTIKKAREKTKEQKEEFQAIFDYTKDGIAIMDLKTNFLNCNQAYLDITGFDKDEILTKSCIGLSIKEDIPKVKNAMKTVLEVGHIENLEKSCIVKDGKYITINMSISMLPDKKRLLATTKDITQMKLLESQAKLASMGEMIGNIAHQWRQPLSVISTSASGLKLKKEFDMIEDVDIDETMDAIVAQTDYLSQTIDDFRNFIKEGDHKRKNIAIVDVINKAITLVNSSLKNHYIELVLDIEDDMTISAYENELVQAIINIVNNAKDAIEEHLDEKDDKYVFIKTKIVKESLELTILDNGGGINQNIMERVFEPYFTTKHQSVGTGIGLTLARNIIMEHHNASINISNEEYEYKGNSYRGACFKIVFNKEA